MLFARCLLVCPGTTRQQPARVGREPRGSPHRPALTGIESADLIPEQRLLIRGFGVRVPGGAPILTWGYTHFGSPREGRFGAMFAPRLLVSPDLVPRAALAGLAPTRSARPGVPSRPQHQLQSGPTDGITQRDICRIAQLEGSGPRPQVHARYIGGTREVHRVADTRVTAQTSFARFYRPLTIRPGRRARLPMHESPGAG